MTYSLRKPKPKIRNDIDDIYFMPEKILEDACYIDVPLTLALNREDLSDIVGKGIRFGAPVSEDESEDAKRWKAYFDNGGNMWGNHWIVETQKKDNSLNAND